MERLGPRGNRAPKVDPPRQGSGNAIRHGDHVAHIGRLDRVFLAGVAVAEMINELDAGWDVRAEFDQVACECFDHLCFGRAVVP